MDDESRADLKRKELLRTPCGECGQASGYLCVDPGGRELAIGRQHTIRYHQARVDRHELRALMVKARLV